MPSQYTPNTQKRVPRKERPARDFARLALSHYAKEDVKQGVDLVQDGIAVKIFTNSLSSADVVPGVAMYRIIRKDLLKAGAQLYEMRPKAESRKIYVSRSIPSRRIGLHAKAVIFGQKTIFFATFNIHPRSEHPYTEAGLLRSSPELTKTLYEDIEEDLLAIVIS